jgi:hypothetical protein
MSQTVAVDPKKVVIVTEDHGGYLAGKCIACDAGGWLEPRYGYPHRVKGNVMGNRLIHEEDCPMNEVLNDDGSFKK